jgi:hypothetical protein
MTSPSGGSPGKCVVCKKETYMTLFKRALIPIHVCSDKCLIEYLKPVLAERKPFVQMTIDGTREYWFE